MNTAAGEWAAKVAARNEIETAKATRAEARRPAIEQTTFDWTGGGAAICGRDGARPSQGAGEAE